MKQEGNIGEIPFKVAIRGEPEVLQDYVEGVKIGEYELETDDELVMNDVCVATCEITGVDRGIPTVVDIKIHEIDYIRKAERHDTEVEDMMRHLDEAKERQQNERENSCDNCREIDSSTRLTVKDDQRDRDLHYCSKCGRLVSSTEYTRWLQTR